MARAGAGLEDANGDGGRGAELPAISTSECDDEEEEFLREITKDSPATRVQAPYEQQWRTASYEDLEQA